MWNNQTFSLSLWPISTREYTPMQVSLLHNKFGMLKMVILYFMFQKVHPISLKIIHFFITFICLVSENKEKINSSFYFKENLSFLIVQRLIIFYNNSSKVIDSKYTTMSQQPKWIFYDVYSILTEIKKQNLFNIKWFTIW